jgi:phage gpG-like protein
VTVKGDFKRLAQLSASMRRASRTAQQATLRVFAVDLARETDLCFLRSRSPYGEPWQGLKHPSGRRRGGLPLLDSGRLKNSIRIRQTGGGIRVSSNVVYAGIHNYGGTIQHAARSELRRYALKGGGKRARVGLNSRAVRTVRTVASVGEHQGTIPRRQFLPSEAWGLPPHYRWLLRRAADQVQGQLRLGGV